MIQEISENDVKITSKTALQRFQGPCFEIDPFTVDRTGDSNGVFETMRSEIFHFNCSGYYQ